MHPQSLVGALARGSCFGVGSKVQGSGFRVQGSGARVQGSGFRVSELHISTPYTPRRLRRGEATHRAPFPVPGLACGPEAGHFLLPIPAGSERERTHH